jgi:hypothetical protein
MVTDNNVPLPPPPRVLGSGDVPRRSGQPGVYGPTDENLSRMNDEDRLFERGRRRMKELKRWR